MASLKVQKNSFWRVGLSFDDGACQIVGMNNVAKHPILGYLFKLLCPHKIAEIDTGTKKVIVNRKSLLKHLFVGEKSNIEIKDLKKALSAFELNKLSSKSFTCIYERVSQAAIKTVLNTDLPIKSECKTPKLKLGVAQPIAPHFSPLTLDQTADEAREIQETAPPHLSQEEFDLLTVKQLHGLSSEQCASCFNHGLYQKRIFRINEQVKQIMQFCEKGDGKLDAINQTLNVRYESTKELLSDVEGLKNLPDNSRFLTFERGFFQAGRGVATVEKLGRIKKIESKLSPDAKMQYEQSEEFRLKIINEELKTDYTKEEDFFRDLIGQFWLSEEQIRKVNFKALELNSEVEEENKIFFDALFTCYKNLFRDLLKNDSDVFFKLVPYLPQDLITEVFNESHDLSAAANNKETLTCLVRSSCTFSPKQIHLLLNHGIFRSDLGEPKERYRLENFEKLMQLLELDKQAQEDEKLDLEKVGNGLINIMPLTGDVFPKKEFVLSYSEYLPFLAYISENLSKKDLKQIGSLDFAKKYRSIAMNWLTCASKSSKTIHIKKRIGKILTQEQLLNYLKARRWPDDAGPVGWVKYLPKELVENVDFEEYTRTCLSLQSQNDPLIEALTIKKAGGVLRRFLN